MNNKTASLNYITNITNSTALLCRWFCRNQVQAFLQYYPVLLFYFRT